MLSPDVLEGHSMIKAMAQRAATSLTNSDQEGEMAVPNTGGVSHVYFA